MKLPPINVAMSSYGLNSVPKNLVCFFIDNLDAMPF